MSETQATIDKAEEIATYKLWGKHSLSVLELVGFVIGGYLVYKPPAALGEKWGRVLGLAIIFVCTALG